MSAKTLSKVELNCSIISGKQGTHLLPWVAKHHRLERIRRARDDTLGLGLEKTYQRQ